MRHLEPAVDRNDASEGHAVGEGRDTAQLEPLRVFRQCPRLLVVPRQPVSARSRRTTRSFDSGQTAPRSSRSCFVNHGSILPRAATTSTLTSRAGECGRARHLAIHLRVHDSIEHPRRSTDNSLRHVEIGFCWAGWSPAESDGVLGVRAVRHPVNFPDGGVGHGGSGGNNGAGDGEARYLVLAGADRTRGRASVRAGRS